MLQLNLFKRDLQKRNAAIEKLVDERIRNARQYAYPNLRYSYSEDTIREQLRKDIEEASYEGSYEKIESVWINPTQIKRIEECHDTLSDERYLRICMIDDKQYCIQENSVEEFMLKNIIIGSI